MMAHSNRKQHWDQGRAFQGFIVTLLWAVHRRLRPEAAYPAGHATVAGACSALLKAFFDETGLITDAVEASPDGLTLTPCKELALTVGGEVNKLALNIALGRNLAGIHYRSDAMAGFRLGEDVAMAMMQDLVNTFTEDFTGFEFTRMDGTSVQICKSCTTG
jgi:hypothetical protein